MLLCFPPLLGKIHEESASHGREIKMAARPGEQPRSTEVRNIQTSCIECVAQDKGG